MNIVIIGYPDPKKTVSYAYAITRESSGLKAECNLKLRDFLKQRLLVGGKAACSVLICPCDAEQRTVMRSLQVKGKGTDLWIYGL